MVQDVFVPYGISADAVSGMCDTLHSSSENLEAFLMKFHHESGPTSQWQAYITGSTLAGGYFLGGLVPLIPYLCVGKHKAETAFFWSIGVMAVTLLVFGYVKTCIVDGWSGRSKILAGIWGACEMLLVGGLAAGAAYGLVRGIDRGNFVS